MKKGSSKYPLEFRQDAVNHLITSGKSISQAAADLGIADHNLRYWKNDFMKKASQNDSSKEDPAQRMRRLEEENKRLEKENANLKTEAAILKKVKQFCKLH